MILSVSRRTDIPCFYSDWFFNRIKDGYVYVRNPMNRYQVSKIDLSPDVVDCIVFWTKNPKPMMKQLDLLNKYHYYFQFTLTGYGKEIETNVPDKKSEVIPTFIALSDRIGKQRVIWRYDPILLTDRYTMEYHIKAFSEIAQALENYTEKVVISFIDFYEKTKRNTKELKIEQLDEQKVSYLASRLSEIAHKHGLQIESCAELIDLKKYGIAHGRCIDDRLIEKIIGAKLRIAKDSTQRAECGCVQSIDIGAYDTCLNGCNYCYANGSPEVVKCNATNHRVTSPLIVGEVDPTKDKITQRKVTSFRDDQLELSDFMN